jgi:hypothetical protein
MSIMKPIDIACSPWPAADPSTRRPPTRALAGQAEHLRLRRAVDVGVEQTDGGAFLGQRQRQIDRRRALADAALAGGDGDDVLHPGQRLQAALHGVGDDLDATLTLTLPMPGRLRSLAITARRISSSWVFAG